MPTITPSPYQTAIYQAVNTHSDSLSIEGVPGCGKTHTSIHAMSYLPRVGSTISLAFNKAIATEQASKVPFGIDAKTFNSLGSAIIRQNLSSSFDTYKVNKAVRQRLPHALTQDKFVQSQIVSLIRRARSAGFGYLLHPEPDDFLALMISSDSLIPSEVREDIANLLPRLLEHLNNNTEVHDFDDQILFPLLHNLPSRTYDNIFVDEAQDLNTVQHHFLRHLLSPNSRIYAFGDPRQAIYGFRGADVNSMSTMQELFDMTSLPLSVTYRCPISHVAAVSSIAPEMEPAPNAIEGTINTLTEAELGLSSFLPSDLLVCRMNWPLYRLALRMLRERRPVQLLGDFSEQLANFIRSFKSNDLVILLDRMQEWLGKELQMLEKRKAYGAIERVKDKVAVIAELSADLSSTDELIALLEDLTSPKVAPKFSTIHRAKGLEAENVYYLLPELIPAKSARSEAALQQETNLDFVARTRSSSNLTLIYGE